MLNPKIIVKIESFIESIIKNSEKKIKPPPVRFEPQPPDQHPNALSLTTKLHYRSLVGHQDSFS